MSNLCNTPSSLYSANKKVFIVEFVLYLCSPSKSCWDQNRNAIRNTFHGWSRFAKSKSALSRCTGHQFTTGKILSTPLHLNRPRWRDFRSEIKRDIDNQDCLASIKKLTRKFMKKIFKRWWSLSPLSLTIWIYLCWHRWRMESVIVEWHDSKAHRVWFVCFGREARKDDHVCQ